MRDVQWAPRVPLDWIRRLYQSDADGLRDGELLMEAGWGLCARAQSVIDVNRAHDEHIACCPECGADASLDGIIRQPDAAFRCACGWAMDQRGYHRTYKGRQLTGSSIVPFAQDFLCSWTAAGSDEDVQMRAIDTLIHRFHWELEGRADRPVAINFIHGKLPEVFLLICELARAGTPEWERERERWAKNEALYRATIWKPSKYEKLRRR